MSADMGNIEGDIGLRVKREVTAFRKNSDGIKPIGERVEQEKGILSRHGWKADDETRRTVENAQEYASHLGRKLYLQVRRAGISDEDLSENSVALLQDKARKKSVYIEASTILSQQDLIKEYSKRHSPQNLDLAKDAVDQMYANGITLSELRHTETDALVQRLNWMEKHEPTEDFIENAKKYSEQLAEQGLEELHRFGFFEGRISRMSSADALFHSIHDLAKQAGWQVDEGDEKYWETKQYVVNAFNYAKEKATEHDAINPILAGKMLGDLETMAKDEGIAGVTWSDILATTTNDLLGREKISYVLSTGDNELNIKQIDVIPIVSDEPKETPIRPLPIIKSQDDMSLEKIDAALIVAKDTVTNTDFSTKTNTVQDQASLIDESTEEAVERVPRIVSQPANVNEPSVIEKPGDEVNEETLEQQPLESERKIILSEKKGFRVEEKLTYQNALYLPSELQESLGVAADERITVKFGKKTHDVQVVNSSDDQNHDWTFSADTADALHLPLSADLRLVSAFNTETKTLSLGPVFAYLANIKNGGFELEANSDGYEATLSSIQNAIEYAREEDFSFEQGRDAFIQLRLAGLHYDQLRSESPKQLVSHMVNISKWESKNNENSAFVTQGKKYVEHLAAQALAELGINVEKAGKLNIADMEAKASALGWQLENPDTKEYISNALQYAKENLFEDDALKTYKSLYNKGISPHELRMESEETILERLQVMAGNVTQTIAAEQITEAKKYARYIAQQDVRKLLRSGLTQQQLTYLPFDAVIQYLQKHPTLEAIGIDGDRMYLEAENHAQDVGIGVGIFDPFNQEYTQVKDGLAQVWMRNKDGYLQRYLIPTPTVANSSHDVPNALYTFKLLEHGTDQLMNPNSQEKILEDSKFKFARIMEEEGLGNYQPKTYTYNENSIADFESLFAEKEECGAIIKPNDGVNGKYIYRVKKTGEGYSLSYYETTGEVVEQFDSSGLIPLFSRLHEMTSLKGREFIAQEYIEKPILEHKDPTTGVHTRGFPEDRLYLVKDENNNWKVVNVVTRVMPQNPPGINPQEMYSQNYGEEDAQLLIQHEKDVAIQMAKAVEKHTGSFASMVVDLTHDQERHVKIIEAGTHSAIYSYRDTSTGQDVNIRSQIAHAHMEYTKGLFFRNA